MRCPMPSFSASMENPTDSSTRLMAIRLAAAASMVPPTVSQSSMSQAAGICLAFIQEPNSAENALQ
jgi:hypothetical protein